MAAGGSPWRRAGSGHERDPGRRPQDAAHLLEHGRVPVAVRPARRLRPGDRDAPRPARSGRVLDRWALSEAHRLAAAVDAALEDFDTQRAGRLLATSSTTCPTGTCAGRGAGSGRATPRALATLHEALRTVTLLMAPFTPFITERVWQDLVVATDSEAPALGASGRAGRPVDAALVDDALAEQMALGPTAGRARSRRPRRRGVKTRQPLPRALVGRRRLGRPAAELRAQVADELNVVALEPPRPPAGDLVDYARRPTSARSGKRFGQADPGRGRRRGRRRCPRAVAADSAAAGTAVVDVDGRAGGARRRRRDRHRDPAGGLGGGTATPARRWPSTWSSPRPCRRGRPGPRGRSGWSRRPARPPGFEVTDRIAVWWDGLRRDRGGAPGARGPAGRRGAGGQPGRRRSAGGARSAHGTGTRADLLAAPGLTCRRSAFKSPPAAADIAGE